MIDCDFFDRKHHFKIVGAKDHCLVGSVFFDCRNCDVRVAVDRFWLYQSMMRRG